jgi:hypothetical protein
MGGVAMQFVSTGTTPPIFVPHGTDAQPVRPALDYFLIRVHAAQACYLGSVWERARRLVVTSRVNLNHPALGGEDVWAIQRTRPIRRGHAEQIGITTNLVSLVPATMTHVSVSVDFIVDVEDRLAALTSLINDDSLTQALSLAPGAALAAAAIGRLAQKIIRTLVPVEGQQPVLQFASDFNLDGEGLRDGFYVVLGSQDDRVPLPQQPPKLTITDRLLADGEPVTSLSYVVLDVRRSPARLRERSGGALWDAKLREAEGLALLVGEDPAATDEQRREAWLRCRGLLQEAQVLLYADSNYLASEAKEIYIAAFRSCVDELQAVTRTAANAEGWPSELQARGELGIPADEDLDAVLDSYAEKVEASRRVLAAAGGW